VDLPDSVSAIGLAAFYRCTSLNVVRLPEALAAVSLDAFQGCCALTTIHTPPSFTTATAASRGIDNDIVSWRNVLLKEQFYPLQLSHVLDNGQSKPSQHSMYYDWKTLAKNTYKSSGRYPLSIAAEKSIRWSSSVSSSGAGDTGGGGGGGGGWLQKLFVAYMPAIEVCDCGSGLWTFMLAAVGRTSDLETVYQLLREYPAAIHT